jgi:hypothetical protein
MDGWRKTIKMQRLIKYRESEKGNKGIHIREIEIRGYEGSERDSREGNNARTCGIVNENPDKERDNEVGRIQICFCER